ncbi:hypothetical protein AHF37_09196 [Paragonimus kellicotti]|nr:hypothetical protein AHF37_09196 [Paragonimus kellicotti]
MFYAHRPPPNEITRKSERFGNVLHKYISHRSVIPTVGDASIIELRLNSTYRGLPEVYLLHEGCAIVGELFQLICFYAFSFHRPPPNEITRKSERFGNVLHKYISHRSVIPTVGDASIIELRLNSTYRGLPEVYLLHEGCAIVGELFQSSRLVDTGLSPVVLPPSKIQFNRAHPSRIRRRLGILDNCNIPIHLHRTSVFLPTPVRIRSSSTDCVRYRSTVQSPVSFKKISQTLSNNFDHSNLSWTKLSKSGDPESSDCLVLTCNCPSLPSYFAHTMQRLSLDFDYSSWLISQKS